MDCSAALLVALEAVLQAATGNCVIHPANTPTVRILQHMLELNTFVSGQCFVSKQNLCTSGKLVESRVH